jgi:hypothetical protein
MVVGMNLGAVVVLVLGIGLESMSVRMRMCRIVVRVRMGVDVGMLVGMHSAIRMRVFVSVRMRVQMRVRVVLAAKDFVARHVLNAVHDDVDLGGGDSGALDTGDLDFGSEVQFADGVTEEFRGDSGVDEGAEEHIAADAGETIEVSDPHRRPLRRSGRTGESFILCS